MKTAVYLLYTDPEREPAFASELRMEELTAGLSRNRQEKIRAMKMPGAKRLSLGAGLLLAHGLEQLGIREQQAVLEYRKNGKPYLKDYPEIYFNLSHSGTMAMAVFADVETGCDIEQTGRGREQVARRFFTPQEQEYLGHAGDESAWAQAFCRIWTMKEAFLKVTGEGARIPLTDFCVHPEADPVTVVWKGKEQPFDFYEIPVTGYRCTLCMARRSGKAAEPPGISWVALD